MVGIIHEVYFDKAVMTQYIHNYFVGVSLVVVNKNLILIRFKNGAHVEISLIKTDSEEFYYRAEIKKKFTSLEPMCVYERQGVDSFDSLLNDINGFLG